MDLRFRSVKRMFVMRPIKKHDPRHGCDYAARAVMTLFTEGHFWMRGGRNNQLCVGRYS
jgi:hypothetical protein